MSIERTPEDVAQFDTDMRRIAATRRKFGLDPDAPLVPKGMRPCVGVEYGCGDPLCRDCYEPMTAGPLGSIDNPLR